MTDVVSRNGFTYYYDVDSNTHTRIVSVDYDNDGEIDFTDYLPAEENVSYSSSSFGSVSKEDIQAINALCDEYGDLTGRFVDTDDDGVYDTYEKLSETGATVQTYTFKEKESEDNHEPLPKDDMAKNGKKGNIIQTVFGYVMQAFETD